MPNPKIETQPDMKQMVHTVCGKAGINVWSDEANHFVNVDGKLVWDMWMSVWRCVECNAPMTQAVDWSNKNN
jgi:hypothetical protein